MTAYVKPTRVQKLARAMKCAVGLHEWQHHQELFSTWSGCDINLVSAVVPRVRRCAARTHSKP